MTQFKQNGDPSPAVSTGHQSAPATPGKRTRTRVRVSAAPNVSINIPQAEGEPGAKPRAERRLYQPVEREATVAVYTTSRPSAQRSKKDKGLKKKAKPQKSSRKSSLSPRYAEPSPITLSEEDVRLNKYISNAGVCSRREADKIIQSGRVTVNGLVVTEMGSRVHPQDKVEVDGKAVTLEEKVYVLLNKPKNCVTTADDPQCRTTVMDMVKDACRERIYPVGRLDRNTTGVLLLTNDGDLAARLMHPAFRKKKIYHVWLDKPVAEEDMEQIASCIELSDGEIHADALSYASDSDLSQVGIEIHSGRNRIVRRIFEHLGYQVRKLDRVYFAGLTKKNLPRGRWRYLNEEEVRNLRLGALTPDEV